MSMRGGVRPVLVDGRHSVSGSTFTCEAPLTFVLPPSGSCDGLEGQGSMITPVYRWGIGGLDEAERLAKYPCQNHRLRLI